ncbi:MAG TPA: hypothetical protein VI357_12700 [Mycobacteriales bacterium]
MTLTLDRTVARHRSLTAAMVLVGLLAFAAAALGAGVHSTYGGAVAVDEPQYLLSALSLWEDHDLDISDELAERRYLAFHDADLPVQTATRPDGRQLSPHDPLLPVLLAVPMGLGGWVAARLTLALLGGILAGLLLWVAVRRFAVPPRLAVPGVALATGTAPLAVYGQQVYPELPGALAALVALAALTAPRPTPRTLTVFALAVIALPWLSVKYAPVGAALVLVALLRLGRSRRSAALTAALAAGGIVYLAAHKAIYGGITAYASGDAFQGSGEFGVVGFHPDYPGRSIRLLGLLIDRDFGLAAWQPAWLLLIPALVAVLGRRPPHWPVLVVPLLAGWVVATWVALTMQGFWWPGRQLVVVLPLAVLLILVWLRNGPRKIALGLAALGVAYYGILLVTGHFGQTRWVLAPDDLRLHWPAALLLPDDRDLHPADVVRYAAWVVLTVLIALRTARRAGRERAASRR